MNEKLISEAVEKIYTAITIEKNESDRPWEWNNEALRAKLIREAIEMVVKLTLEENAKLHTPRGNSKNYWISSPMQGESFRVTADGKIVTETEYYKKYDNEGRPL